MPCRSCSLRRSGTRRLACRRRRPATASATSACVRCEPALRGAAQLVRRAPLRAGDRAPRPTIARARLPARRGLGAVRTTRSAQQIAVEQEVEEAARLRREVLGLALLLLDGEQLGLRAQHLVFGDLAVVEQRFVDAQVLAQQHLAGCHDLHRAASLEPVEISDRDVTPQSARDGHSVVAARTEQRALRANGSGNCGCVQRLTHD